MAASALLKQYRIHREEMDGRNFFVKKRNTVLWKKLFPAIKHSKLQRKMCLGTTNLDHSPFL